MQNLPIIGLFSEKFSPNSSVRLEVPFRDGSKFIGYPGRAHRQGGEDFFSKKIRGAETFFRKKLGGRELFFEKN